MACDRTGAGRFAASAGALSLTGLSKWSDSHADALVRARRGVNGEGIGVGYRERYVLRHRLFVAPRVLHDVRMCPMTPLRPAPASVEDSQLWMRVVDVAGARGLAGDALREVVLGHAVSELRSRLGDDEAVQALSVFAENDDDADGWAGARFQAAQLGMEDRTAILVLFLISERTTSGARQSPYARTLAETAARRSPGPSSRDVAASEMLAAHGAAFARFLDAQRDLTEELLEGMAEVTLHRGIQTAELAEAGEADPGLRPLSSFSTSPACAVSLAQHGSDAGGAGVTVLLSAVVPTERVLATPATGAGAVLEREVVVTAGAFGDRVTVTLPGAASP